VKVQFTKSLRSDNFEIKYLETTIDVCKLFEGVRANIFSQVFYDISMNGNNKKDRKG
jgi:hypothetical protein